MGDMADDYSNRIYDEYDDESVTVKVKCYEVGGTDKALLVSRWPKGQVKEPGIWLPKSLLEHITRHPVETGMWRPIEIVMPEWLADKKGLI